MPVNLSGEVVFVPADPPRAGRVAFCGDGPDEVELVLPIGSGVRRRRVTARLMPLAEALPALLTQDAATASHQAWAAAATAGLRLVARGRLLPAISPAGYDAWRAGPLDPADAAWLNELAAAFPPQAHALPLDGSRPLRVREPKSLIRDFWDAVADALAHSPAAAEIAGQHAFATPEPTPVPELKDWLTETDRGLDSGARLGLRLEPIRDDESCCSRCAAAPAPGRRSSPRCTWPPRPGSTSTTTRSPTCSARPATSWPAPASRCSGPPSCSPTASRCAPSPARPPPTA